MTTTVEVMPVIFPYQLEPKKLNFVVCAKDFLYNRLLQTYKIKFKFSYAV